MRKMNETLSDVRRALLSVYAIKLLIVFLGFLVAGREFDD